MNYSNPGNSLVCLGLGSNLGNSRQILKDAISQLRDVLSDVIVSPLYRTNPQDNFDQDDFFNCCISGEWDDSYFLLLQHCLRIESELGRVRDNRNRKGPRLIDIDILWVEGVSFKSESLEIPHSRLKNRAFALQPMIDLLPDAQDPVDFSYYRDLIYDLSDQGIYSETW